MKSTRQLAVIMFTDISGYTALMGQDEEKAITILEQNRQLQKPIIEAHGGRLIKEMGDGIMASFQSASDAVKAAMEIQARCKIQQRYQLRIGMHLGEVLFENEDVFGDGVNIASRVQSITPAGLIYVTEAVYANISNKKDFHGKFLREEQLKNVQQPIRIYQVEQASGLQIKEMASGSRDIGKSIAVLPFVNMSSDPEQEYFSDGISEEIINMLAQVPELKVSGRTSSFSFKHKDADLREIGNVLNVKYILEGSVRKAGNLLRITAQLINADDGFHLYSERFDRELKDVFAIQDEISLAILDAIKIKLLKKEEGAVLKKNTGDLAAYEYYLKGRFHINRMTPDDFRKAIQYLDQAIEIEPGYALAYANRAFCYMNMVDFNWIPPEKGKPEVLMNARKSFELDENLAESNLAVGRIKLHWEWEIEEAAVIYKRAIAINPNYAESHIQLGMCLALLERKQEAIERAEMAASLDPLSVLNLWYSSVMPFAAGDWQLCKIYADKIISLAPQQFPGYNTLGWTYIVSRQYHLAVKAFEKMVEYAPGTYSMGYLGMAFGLNGEHEKARNVLDQMQDYLPHSSEANHSIGNVYFALREWDIALEYYEKSYAHHEGQLLWIKYIWRAIPECFEDPRFLDLLGRIGAPLPV